MSMDSYIGNAHVVQALRGMADGGRIPHAIMFYENEGGGALRLCLEFMQYINPGHKPEIHFSFPITSGNKVSGEVKNLTCDQFSRYWKELMESNPYFLESELSAALGFEKKQGTIAVAEGRAILQKLSLSSAQGGYRAVLVWLPERMNRQTANMLLKAIEEPAEGDLFLMVTHSPESVLQTISSRCQALRLLPLSREEVARVLTEEFNVSSEEALRAAAFAGGSVGWALQSLSESSESARQKELLADLLDSVCRRDFLAGLEAGEQLAALDSREKQKAFCLFASGVLRSLFMKKQGLDSISGIAPEDEDWFSALAGSLPAAFPEKGEEVLDRTVALLERNVSAKMLFCNLVSSFFAIR